MARYTRKLKKNKPLWPHKYYAGLTKKQSAERRKEILQFSKLHWKDPRAYVGFKTNKYGKRKTSSYTAKFRKLFPDAKSLKEKAEATGVPQSILKTVYNRGMGAWRTGHRPGATEQQWGYARVHSFLLCGKTYYGPDSDQVRLARETSASARKWFENCAKQTNH